ncbi:TerD family protein [Streptomyces sp. NBC_01361]|uniref:TerD family protein n=1 Tax=Streptomyces sp. NBC_01361 TaxID=2903838 RepID=UPI003FCC3A36
MSWAHSSDKAAICVSFDGLPDEADRFVLVVAIDPEVNPDADLSGFRDACIRLLNPGLTELGRLEVSDGRPRETALVLGSFPKAERGRGLRPGRQGLHGRPGGAGSGLRHRGGVDRPESGCCRQHEWGSERRLMTHVMGGLCG